MKDFDFSCSVTRLVNALVESENSIKNKKRNYKKNENGKYYHQILEFYGSELYESIIEYGGFRVRIYGSPDRVDRERRVVEELKTYRFKENLDFQKRKGKYQLAIYCYLVGYSDAILYIYNVVRRMLERTIYFYIPREDQINVIKSALAILLKNKLSQET
ncbi:MAG: PD-(D/E)XK nuclease family protein [Candidatus Aenigmatarchaeota archaeon]